MPKEIKVLQDYIPTIAQNYEKANPVMRTQGNYARTFDNFYPNISIKSEYTREDYGRFRPNSDRPKTADDMVRASQQAYDNVGIVRNVIDLMADLAKKGIRLVHPDKRVEQFYREWWKTVNGDRVSERFLNYLYRIANVPVYKTYAKIPLKVEKKWKSAYAIDFKPIQTETRRIPIRYNFINPTSIEVIAPEVSMFTGKKVYAIRIGSVLRSSLSNLKNRYRGVDTKEIINSLPDEIKKMLEGKQELISISSDELKIFHYKKDDWDVWAKPMINSIYDDVLALQKMKLADMSALDGAISNIRLWRLGQLTDNPQTCLFPTPEMLQKLQSILANNIGGGTMDLVWGPELDFKESNTQVHRFLGMTKYEPVLHQIYQGLGFGIAIDKGSTMGGNTISMQTLIERLEYGRSVLVEFWNYELKEIQLAMGYNSPAEVQFDKVTIGDETGMMKLLIELWDRNVITDSMLQESFDFFPEVVKKKLMTEYKARRDQKYIPKSGPYFNPNTQDELKKIILQAGGATPSEVGLELDENEDGQVPMIDKTGQQAMDLADKTGQQQMDMADKSNEHAAKLNKENNKAKIQQIKYKPRTNNGRPKNSKDQGNRKKRVAKASTDDNFVNRMLWAQSAQKDISEIVTKGWVEKACGKKDIRSLTTSEAEQLEFIKFGVLCQLEPYSSVDITTVASKVKGKISNDFLTAVAGLMAIFVSRNGRTPTLEEKRQIQASAYALKYEPDEVDSPLTTEEELNNDTLAIIGG